jgi:YD repeat-containing protein
MSPLRRFLLQFSALALLTTASLTAGQVSEISNITSTPVAGSGHDYLTDLSEIVNPANGSVSIRIAAPVPHERRASYPVYAYTYDTNGQFNLTFVPMVQTYGAGAEIYALGPYVQTVAATTGGTTGYFGAGGVTYQRTALSYCTDPLQSGGCGVQYYCTYLSGFIATDPSGGRHDLGVGVEINGGRPPEDCTGIGVLLYSAGGDESYKVDTTCYSNNAPVQCNDTSSGHIVVDLHGDANTTGVEDTNGNYLNTDGRSWTFPYSYYYLPGFVAPTSMTFPDFSTAYKYGTQGGTSGSLYSSSNNPLNATLRYNSLASTDYGSDCQLPPVGGASQGGQLPGGASSVTLPNNQQYTFTYDPTYAFIKTITYPTGATVKYNWAIDPQSEVSGFQGGTGIVVGRTISNNNQICAYTVDMPRVQSRIVSYNGVTPAVEQDFAYSTQWNTNYNTWGASNPWTKKTTTVTTIDLIRPGHPSYKTVYTYVPMANARQMVGASTTFPVPLLPVESTVVYQSTSGNVLRTSTKVWNTPNQLAAECVTLDNGQIGGTFYKYAQYSWGSINSVAANSSRAYYTNLITDRAEYDYGTVASSCTQPTSTPLKETKTTYASLGGTAYWTHAPALVDRPRTIQVYGTGTLLSETDYAYDETALATVTPAPYGHDETNYGPNPGTVYARGNATTITKKCWAGSLSCTNAVWKIAYDTTGQPVSVTDANGNTTSIVYLDQFLSGSGMPPQPTNEYVTKIIKPVTNGVSHIETFQWNYNQGELAVSTDENGGLSYFYYNDPWNRLTEANYPGGGTIKHLYQDAPPISVTTCKLIDGTSSATCSASTPPSGWETDVVLKDGVGHVVDSQLASDPAGTSHTATTWDGAGKPYQIYNPTRCSSPTSNCGTETTWGVTTELYDSLGRVCLIVRPDVATVPTACPTSAQAGDVFTSYSGNCTTVYDESGHARSSCSNVLGQITGVWEDPAGLNYETDYAYDALNNLLSVSQKGSNVSQARIRTFSYDSLSRLLCAANPEVQAVTCPASPTGSFPSGALVYNYDPNGNVHTKTAPAPNQTGTATLTTTYKYDALNRLLSKSYSTDTSGTPWSCRQYDVSSVTNGVGRLGNEWTQSASAGPCPTALPSAGFLTKRSILAYDPLGRTKNEQQCTPSNCSSTTPYALTFNYDLAGNLTSYTNGISSTPGATASPLTLTNCFDSGGRLQTTTSNWIDSTHPQSLFSAQMAQSSTCSGSSSPTVSTAPYSPAGALQNAFYGTTLESLRSYDNRLRITGEQDAGGH